MVERKGAETEGLRLDFSDAYLTLVIRRENVFLYESIVVFERILCGHEKLNIQVEHLYFHPRDTISHFKVKNSNWIILMHSSPLTVALKSNK